MPSSEKSSLERQLALAEAYWAALVRQGVRPGMLSPVEAFFFATDLGAAEKLGVEFAGTPGWRASVAELKEESPRWMVKVVTRPVVLAREVLLELVKIMVAAASEHGCDFDGFGLALPSASSRR